MSKVQKVCEFCGKRFWVHLYRKDEAKYCSYKCYWNSKKGKPAWNKGMTIWWKGHTKKHSVKSRENMSKAHTGMKKPWAGKYKHTKEHNRKIGEAQQGEKSNNWKGGISPKNKVIRVSAKFRLWREAVFARDNWTCQKCGGRSGKGKSIILHPHHIKNFAQYPKLRFRINNGITLCEDCHLQFHKIYGRQSNTKRQLEEFIRGGKKDGK